MSAARLPLLLAPNQPERPYRGGAGIARFRGIPLTSDHTPEDFVGSTTEVHGGGAGLSVLPDGRVLRDAIAQDPLGFLGPAHVDAFGADPRLLVKLLDTGERLFVHYHPTDDFAASALGSPAGKTEAWSVLEVRPQEGPTAGAAFLGFSREVSPEELADWVDRQDVDALVGALNRIPLSAGDLLLVPSGVPHAIGEGVTLVESQQPTDLSVLLEWEHFPVSSHDALLGLDLATALRGVDRSAWTPERLAGLHAGPSTADPELPEQADRFFRMQPVRDGGWDAGFALVIVTAGSGRLTGADWSVDVRAGQTLLVPFAAGDARVHGEVGIVLCRPPVATTPRNGAER